MREQQSSDLLLSRVSVEVNTCYRLGGGGGGVLRCLAAWDCDKLDQWRSDVITSVCPGSRVVYKASNAVYPSRPSVWRSHCHLCVCHTCHGTILVQFTGGFVPGAEQRLRKFDQFFTVPMCMFSTTDTMYT